MHAEKNISSRSYDLHEASGDEVLAFERKLETVIKAFAVPGGDFAIAVYHALTVVEDKPRCIACSSKFTIKFDVDDPSLLAMAGILGQYVFGLRYLLDAARNSKRSARTGLRPITIDGKFYEKMSDALEFFNNVYAARHILAGVRFKNWLCRMDDAGEVLRIEPKTRNEGYDALAFCLAGPEKEEVAPVLAWLTWTKFPGLRPSAIQDIIDSTRLTTSGRINYNLRPELAEQLDSSFPSPEIQFPNDWEFPWGSDGVVRRLMRALQTRCLYHLCAVHFAAEAHEIEGGGVDDLLLVRRQGEIVQDLHKMTGVPLSNIVRFVRALSYGELTKSPDPALQPLIPLAGSTVAIPCILVGSLRPGRNMLSLHARIDPGTFDRQSERFEREMMADLRRGFCEAFTHVRINTRLPKGLGGEEVDLMVFDEKSCTLLLVEARATIMPADPVEVYRRLSEIQRKVGQLQRKILSIRHRVRDLLKWAGVESNNHEWNVVGTVVLRGHGGSLSSDPEIPVVPEYVLLFGVSSHLSAKDLHCWLTSLLWLPQKGMHFESVETLHSVGPLQVQGGGVGGLKPMQYLHDYLPISLAAFKK